MLKFYSPKNQFPSLHDDCRHIDIDFDALVRQDAASVDIDLVADCDVVAEHTDVLQSSPFPDCRVPANNRALHPSMVLDFGSRQQHASLQTDAIADNDIWANGNVGSDSAVPADLRRWVDQDVAAVYVWGIGRCEELGALLGERREVETGPREEILWLSNIHPETVQIKGV